MIWNLTFGIVRVGGIDSFSPASAWQDSGVEVEIYGTGARVVTDIESH